MRARLPVLVAALTLASHAVAVDLAVVERTLPNGLEVLIHPDRSLPVVSSYVFYRAGSRNEHRGQTGIAHLFEHMMFNGGRKFGPGVFDDLIEGNGGSTNGYTTRDYTAYLNNFPKDALPIVLDLESDRMAHLAITKQNLEQERGIVAEERRLRVDNEVTGTMHEALYLHAYERSPYRWATIGFMADILSISLPQARAFFETYYAPNNAVLVLAGDLDPEPTFRLVERCFGRIPRRAPPEPVDMREPPQDGERRVVVRKRAELPALLMGWHGPEATHPDRAALDVATQLLSGGESSRLHRDLVREHEVATEVAADFDWSIGPDLIGLYAQARPGKTAADLERRVDAVIRRLAETAPPAGELAKAKRQLRADWVKGLKTVSGKANKIGFMELVFGDWRALRRLEESWEAVTADDVRRVAATYLVPTKRTVVVLEPLPAERGA